MSSLQGYRIGVTSARRGDELASLLERRGATVESAPALSITACPDDTQLRAVTEACIADPPDVLIASTGIGVRAWIEAAAEWGMGPELLGALRRAEIFARGPKAVGALRGAGLRESWAADTESLADVLAHLRMRDLEGTRVVLQEHGAPLASTAAALRHRGAEVSVATVYRCEPAADHAPLFRMVDLVADEALDAVTFTSAPAVHVLVDVAAAAGRREEYLAALRGGVVAACVGPVTAEAFERWAVPTIQPSRARLVALVREMETELPTRREGTRLDVAGHLLVLRGTHVLVDGAVVKLTPAPYAVLRALARRPGQVLSRRELMEVLPSRQAASEHAVEAAVARLRACIGAALVRTVVKRGYQLAVR